MWPGEAREQEAIDAVRYRPGKNLGERTRVAPVSPPQRVQISRPVSLVNDRRRKAAAGRAGDSSSAGLSCLDPLVGGGAAGAAHSVSECQPVVADQMSVLPNVPGQTASGHGAGRARVPAASDAAR
jgi:hypothetical protein